jgi:hypothetical protein
MPELMIFKAGKYPQGDWPKERVRKMAGAGGPEKNIEAPVVIGHRFYGADGGYRNARGRAGGLRTGGAGKVFAQIPEFSADVKKKLAEGKLRYISAEFYESDTVNAEHPPYLKAVALPGRDTPAVAGTKITLFSLMAGGGLAVVDGEEHIAAFTRKAGAAEIKSLAGKGGREDNRMDELEKLKAEADGLRNAEKKTEAAAFFGKLRDGGRSRPRCLRKRSCWTRRDCRKAAIPPEFARSANSMSISTSGKSTGRHSRPCAV